MYKSDLIDISCEVRSDDPSKAAIAIADGTTVSWDGRMREKWFWIPRQYAEINDDNTITIPEWLALEKGLI